jgi:hypothetical protein
VTSCATSQAFRLDFDELADAITDAATAEVEDHVRWTLAPSYALRDLLAAAFGLDASPTPADARRLEQLGEDIAALFVGELLADLDDVVVAIVAAVSEKLAERPAA